MRRANLLRNGAGNPVLPWMVWWRAGELNPRPRRCERRALPTELAPHLLEPETRAVKSAGFAAHHCTDFVLR